MVKTLVTLEAIVRQLISVIRANPADLPDRLEAIQSQIVNGPRHYVAGLPERVAEAQTRHDSAASLWDACRARREWAACKSLAKTVGIYATVISTLTECVEAGSSEPEYTGKLPVAPSRQELIAAGFIQPA